MISCPIKAPCPYKRAGQCDSLRTYCGNGDATCHSVGWRKMQTLAKDAAAAELRGLPENMHVHRWKASRDDKCWMVCKCGSLAPYDIAALV